MKKKNPKYLLKILRRIPRVKKRNSYEASATVHPTSLLAPARLRAEAHDRIVDPVVNTSSTSRNERPETRLPALQQHANAPSTFAARSSDPSDVCEEVRRTRFTSEPHTGRPETSPIPLHRTALWLYPRSRLRTRCRGTGRHPENPQIPGTDATAPPRRPPSQIPTPMRPPYFNS